MLTNPIRRLVLAGLAGCSLLVSVWSEAYAQGIPPGYPDRVDGYDPREVAMLPRYCLSTQGFRLAKVPGSEDQAVTDRWYAYLGPNFHDLHHYCWAQMKTNRALLLARDAATRRFYLEDSIREFDYVLAHVKDDFLLLPEILTRRAENLARLGKGAIGVLDLERAIALKDDYWPAYAALGDFYSVSGDLVKARETFEAGLAKSPDATALRRRLAELGSPRSGTAKPAER